MAKHSGDEVEGPIPLALPVLREPSAKCKYLVLAIIKLTKRVRPRHGTVLMVSNSICIKYGRSSSTVQVTEAYTLQFVAKNTSIPVPKVLCTFEHRGMSYVVMERIHGKVLGAGWVYRSTESKEHLLSQLRAYIQELRRLQAPAGTGVANVVGGALYDCRMPGSSMRFGPFRDVVDFHRHLRQDFEPHAKLDPEINQLIAFQGGKWPLVFTHGDLSSLNVLVRDDKIVGIVDWETAGWFPSYWEYTTACQVNPQNSFWRAEIDNFLDPYPAELKMEDIRQKYFGAF